MQRNRAPLVIEQTTSSSTRVASRHLLDPASQARPVLANARISYDIANNVVFLTFSTHVLGMKARLQDMNDANLTKWA